MIYGRKFYEGIGSGSAASASKVVPELLKLVNPRSVVDVGCGLGAWLCEFQECGITDIMGIDGDYVDPGMLAINPDHFVIRDLRKPLEITRQFDLAICLEVAEHLPPDVAHNFVGQLVDLAPLVLFSAAIPFQGGADHLNEQWPDYWGNLFMQFGFLPLDCIRARIWNDSMVDWWYRQNIILYAKRDLADASPHLRELADQQPSAVLPLVHPDLYLSKLVAQSSITLRALLRLLPRFVKVSLKRGLGLQATK